MCWRFRDEITGGEKLGFEVKYEREDLVLRRRKDVCFRIESLSMVTYITLWVTLRIWCVQLTDFTALQTFKERTVFW